MSSDEQADRALRLAIIREAKRVEEDAKFNHAGHNEEAIHSDRLHRWLGIPATLIAAAAGITSFSTAGSVTDIGYWSSIIAGSLSFAVAALAGLTTFLDPKASAEAHYRAANAYMTLRGGARYFYEIECIKKGAIERLESALLALRDRLAKLDDQTLIISAQAIKVAWKDIADGGYEYRVDQHKEEPERVLSSTTSLVG